MVTNKALKVNSFLYTKALYQWAEVQNGLLVTCDNSEYLENHQLKGYPNTRLSFSVKHERLEDFSAMLVENNLLFDWDIKQGSNYNIFSIVIDAFAGIDIIRELIFDIKKRFELLNDDLWFCLDTTLTHSLSNVSTRLLYSILPSFKKGQNEKFDTKIKSIERAKKVLFKIVKKVQEQGTSKGDPYDPYYWRMAFWYLESLSINAPYSARELAQMAFNTFKGQYEIENWEFLMAKLKNKEFSTLHSKAKYIIRFWDEHSYYLGEDISIIRGKIAFDDYKRKYSDEELKMTRSENMKRIKTLQKATTQAKIKALIDDNGLFECEFRHKQGQYKGLVNVPKLAKYMDVSEMTIRRNLKDMGIR